MTRTDPLQHALLELGLEDLIPLPEAFGDPEVRAAAGGEPTAEELGTALADLARTGRISVWVGHWADEPRRVETDEAEQLLNDPRRYSFEHEAIGLDRVYYANIENVP